MSAEEKKRKSAISAIFIREIDMMIKNVPLLLIIFVAPVFYPFIYNSIYSHKNEHKIPISVVDLDKSAESREMIRELDSHELLYVKFTEGNIAAAYHQLCELNIMAMIIIPSGFEADLKKQKQPGIHVAINNTRFLVASDINKALSDVIGNKAKFSIEKTFKKAGFSSQQASEMAEPVCPVVVNCYNNTESYGDSMIAALLIMVLQQTLLIGMSISVASEREHKTLGEAFRLSNGSTAAFITGKGIFYFVLYGAYALLFFTVHPMLYTVPLRGSAFALAVLLSIHLLSIIILALLLSSFFKTRFMALCVLMVTSYPIFLLSGYTWPFQSMNGFMQLIAQLLPSTPFFRSYLICTQMGGTLKSCCLQIAQMCLLAAMYCSLLILRVNSLKKRELYN